MIARELLSENVPPWQFGILRDDARLAAFEAALERHAPGKRVLDLGSGSGLLGMMAARAGASRVFGCESNPAVAFVSQAVVQANGFADTISILTGHSDNLDIVNDLAGPVDLIVFEIGGGRGLGESVLPSIENARRLLKPGGRLIPARITLRVALAYAEKPVQRHIQQVRGFDLSAINNLAAPEYGGGSGGLELMSSSADLFRFDFATANPPARAECVLSAYPGTFNCIVQWIRLELDDDTIFENAPAKGQSYARAINIVPLQQSFSLHQQQLVRVAGSHDRHRLRLWLAEQPA